MPILETAIISALIATGTGISGFLWGNRQKEKALEQEREAAASEEEQRISDREQFLEKLVFWAAGDAVEFNNNHGGRSIGKLLAWDEHQAEIEADKIYLSNSLHQEVRLAKHLRKKFEKKGFKKVKGYFKGKNPDNGKLVIQFTYVQYGRGGQETQEVREDQIVFIHKTPKIQEGVPTKLTVPVKEIIKNITQELREQKQLENAIRESKERNYGDFQRMAKVLQHLKATNHRVYDEALTTIANLKTPEQISAFIDSLKDQGFIH